MKEFRLRATLSALLFPLIFITIELHAQDSSSTIYFYRPKNSGPTTLTYEIKDGMTIVGRLKPGTVTIYQCKGGTHEFVATGRTSSSFRLDTEEGKEYFVSCGVSTDSTNRATFRLARRGEARMEIRKIDVGVSSHIIPSAITTSPDTVRALTHLFKRKHGWGIGWTIFGGLGIISSSIQLATNNHEEVPIGYGLTIEQDHTASNVFGLILSCTFTSMGASRLSNYSMPKLDAMLEDRAENKPFPKKVLKALRPRDFVVQP